MSKKQKRILWPVLLVSVVVWTAIAFGWARTATGGSTSPGTNPARAAVIETSTGRHVASIASQQNLLPRVEVEEITIRRYGFEPREISRPAGRFILVIANPGGSPDLDLSIQGEAGQRLQSMRLPRNQRDWNDSLVLPPGRYVLTEAG